MDSSELRLLTRRNCHLCEDAALELKRSGLEFEQVDVDTDQSLRDAYGNAVPVLLLGTAELARAPINVADIVRMLEGR